MGENAEKEAAISAVCASGVDLDADSISWMKREVSASYTVEAAFCPAGGDGTVPVSGGKNVAGRWNDCGGDKQQSWTAPAWILPVRRCSFDDPGRWGRLGRKGKEQYRDGDIPARTGAGAGDPFADSVGKCRMMEDTGWRFGIAGK